MRLIGDVECQRRLQGEARQKERAATLRADRDRAALESVRQFAADGHAARLLVPRQVRSVVTELLDRVSALALLGLDTPNRAG